MESKDLDELNRTTEALMTASHKLAETMYSKTRQSAGAQGAAGAGPGGDGGHAGGAGGAGDGQPPHEESKEDVVDADFKEVK